VHYRAHREKEEAKTNAQWRDEYFACLPFLSRVIHKLLRSKPPWDYPKPERPFTVPPYQPTTEQTQNMARLLALILNEADQSGKADQLEVAELHRELGQFEAAADALSSCNEDHQQVTKRVISEQIELRSAAPIRYRE
jgi:thioredoxin-like negative regulator of GroEL